MALPRSVVLAGDCRELLARLPSNCLDAVVTDPPYGLGKPPKMEALLSAWLKGEPYRNPRRGGFMGAEWDSEVPGPDVWREVLRVLKPGGHLVAFAGARTVDLMGLSLRLSGFEIRDVLAWLQAQGMPKSTNIGLLLDKKRDDVSEIRVVCRWLRRHMEATGTSSRAQLKDALGFGDELDEEVERLNQRKNQPGEAWHQRPITGEAKTARGAVTYSITSIDGFRRETAATDLARSAEGYGTALRPCNEPILLARKPLEGTIADNFARWGTGALCIAETRTGRGNWPPNVVLGETAAAELDALHGKRRGSPATFKRGEREDYGPGDFHPRTAGETFEGYGDAPGGASRFFFCPKTSKSERELGCEALPEVRRTDGRTAECDNPRLRTSARRNHHPTVKPIALMEWLVSMVTPPGGRVLDPFTGSGSTGIAALRTGRQFVGFERVPEYVEIALARLEAWKPETLTDLPQGETVAT